MRTVVIFRMLLLISAALVVAGLVLRATQIGLPSELVRYKNETAPSFGDWAGLANYFFGISFLIIFGWAIVGLYFFQSLGKKAALTAMLLFVLLPIVRGPSVEFGWTISLEHVALALLAAAFVLARTSPLAELFPRE